MTDTTERLGTVRQACEFWQVSRRTIYNWLRSGKLEASRTPGGLLRIKLRFNDVASKPAQVKNIAPNTCARCSKPIAEHLLVNFFVPAAYGEEAEVGEQGLVCPTALYLES